MHTTSINVSCWLETTVHFDLRYTIWTTTTITNFRINGKFVNANDIVWCCRVESFQPTLWFATWKPQRGLIDNKYVQHIRLLSFAIYTLSKKQISFDEIETADQQLKQFTENFQKLYGESNVTMNLHLLNHLANSVRKLGPLWATSAYAYETNNGVVIKSNTSKKDIVHQLAYKYVVRQTIEKIKPVNEFSFSGELKIDISPAEKELFLINGIRIDSKTFKLYKKIDFITQFIHQKVSNVSVRLTTLCR